MAQIASDSSQQQQEENVAVYLAYRNQFPCWPLIALAVSLNLVGTVGILMNFGVVWTTVRCHTLHGTANWLLAFCSFCEILHQHGHWLYLWNALSPTSHFIDLELALKLTCLSLFGLGCLNLAMFFTGLDRLLCVLIPAFPQKVSRIPYLIGLTGFCVGLALFQLIDVFWCASKMPNLQVTGMIGDLFQGGTNVRYSVCWMTLSTVTILLYLVVGLAFHLKTMPTSNNLLLKQRRLFRSLLIIILLNIGGYYLIFFFVIFIKSQIESLVNRWLCQQIFAMLTNVSAASIGPILYWTSTEYRKAFNREFDWIFRFFVRNINNNNNNNNNYNVQMYNVQPHPKNQLTFLHHYAEKHSKSYCARKKASYCSVPKIGSWN